MDEAATRSGLSDWGNDLRFETGLERIVETVNSARHKARIAEQFREDMVRLLTVRLHFVEEDRCYPEITATPIERPLILIGLARTGTTILHDLLALDPAVRAPLEWETVEPWPAPEIGGYDTDPRIERLQSRLDQRLKATPELTAMHPYGATLPSDCLNIMAVHFVSAIFSTRYAVDSYSEWLTTTDGEGVYTTHRRVLQELQWKGPRGRWTLKEVTHQLYLPALASTYPDACFVQTHRDPARTIPSAADLQHTLQAVVNPDRNPNDTGRTARKLFGACLERCTEARAADPALDARVLDVAFSATVLDPVGQVRRIHEHFGLPFSEEHAKRIDEHMAGSTAAAHGRHQYRAQDYGLDPRELREAFPLYRERFGHLLEEPTRT